MEAIHLTLRVIHVLFGVFWAGATFMIALFLEPTVREAGPAGGAVMGGMVRRGYTKFISVVALVSVLTGLWLMWRLSGHFSSGFMGSRRGILLSIGMLAGLLALGTGVHMVRKAVTRLAEIGGRVAASGAPPNPEDQAEMARLQGKVRTATRITAVLLLVAVVTMALGPHM
jgi:uncharacterized membrane protein